MSSVLSDMQTPIHEMVIFMFECAIVGTFGILTDIIIFAIFYDKVFKITLNIGTLIPIVVVVPTNALATNYIRNLVICLIYADVYKKPFILNDVSFTHINHDCYTELHVN